MEMKVTVVVPVYNEEKRLRPCLKHIFNQSEKPDEVIVVDNNCTDRSMEVAKKFPVRIVKETKQGMIQARNKGFNAAKYAIIARTDADTLVPKHWIKQIKQNFKADTTLDALAGPSHFSRIPDVLQVSDWPTAVFFKSFRQICGFDCLYGPNMAIKRAMWREVRDDTCERDKDVHEDVDLALHVARHGGKIKFDSSLIVTCSPRRWKKIKPYFEYPYRYIKTIRSHYDSLLTFEGKRLARRSRHIVKKVVPNTKKLIRVLTSQ